MSRILHWRFCGTLSVMLAVCMVLPVMALAGSVVASAKPVVIANSPGDYKISLGKGEDARVGAKGVISRHDKDIAKFEITSVEWGYSCVKLTDVSANETVLVGDGVQLTTVPPPTKIKKCSCSATMSRYCSGKMSRTGGRSWFRVTGVYAALDWKSQPLRRASACGSGVFGCFCGRAAFCAVGRDTWASL